MFNYYALSLITAAVVVMALSVKTPRAWMWIGIGGASFFASSMYWELSTTWQVFSPELHPAVTFFCDGLCCVCFHKWCRERWELATFLCFLISCFVSLVALLGLLPNTIVYAAMLETCNWIALLIIGGVGLTDLVGKHEDGVIGSVHRSLHHVSRSF